MLFYSTKLACVYVFLFFCRLTTVCHIQRDNDVRTFVFNVPTPPIRTVHKKQSTAVFSMKFINRDYFPRQTVPYKVRRNNDIKTELSLLRRLIMLRIAIKGTRKSVKKTIGITYSLVRNINAMFYSKSDTCFRMTASKSSVGARLKLEKRDSHRIQLQSQIRTIYIRYLLSLFVLKCIFVDYYKRRFKKNDFRR